MANPPISPLKRNALLSTAVVAAAAIFIAPFEGAKVRTGYVDVAGVPTSCQGHTGPDVVVDRVYTDAECTALLNDDTYKHAVAAQKCVIVDVPKPAAIAFISFAYNLGPGPFCNGIAPWVNSGNLAQACHALRDYNKAHVTVAIRDKHGRVIGHRRTLVVLKGLDTRRKAEEALCLQSQ